MALIDIRLQDGTGIDLTQEIRRKYPHIQVIGLNMYDSEAKYPPLPPHLPRVIGLNMYGSEAYLEAMLKAEARGYLRKNTSREEAYQGHKDRLGRSLLFF